MNLRGFHHLAIQVHDLARMTAFYTEVLGLPEQVRHHRPDGSWRAVWLSLDVGFLALEACEDAPGVSPFRHPEPGFHLLALRIRPQDRDGVVQELARRGIEFVHQTRWTVYFRDPEGNRIGLSHHPDDPITG